jgi:hypothetical protein
MVDQGVAIVAAGLLAILGGLAGAALQFILGERRRREDRAYLGASEKRARIRDYELRRINHTRRQLERTRLTTISVIAGKSSENEPADALEHSDMRVIGDADAAAAWVAIIMRLAGEAEAHLRRTGQLPIRLLTAEESQEIVVARNSVMHALDAQERRALADEPLAVLSAGDVPGLSGQAQPPTPPV